MSAMVQSMLQVHEVLRGKRQAATVAPTLDMPVDRLEAYQQFVHHHIVDALEQNYSTFVSLLTEVRWQHLADGYFRAFPADDYELNASVAAFPDYIERLAKQGTEGMTPAHAELADFEQREFAVFAAPIEIPADSEIDRPLLNPTLQIMRPNFPVGSFVHAYRTAQGAAEDLPSLPTKTDPETLFVFRHPRSLRHSFAVGEPALLFAFKVAADNLDLAQAAATADITTEVALDLLRAAATVGLIVLPRSMQSKPTDD